MGDGGAAGADGGGREGVAAVGRAGRGEEEGDWGEGMHRRWAERVKPQRRAVDTKDRLALREREKREDEVDQVVGLHERETVCAGTKERRERGARHAKATHAVEERREGKKEAKGRELTATYLPVDRWTSVDDGGAWVRPAHLSVREGGKKGRRLALSCAAVAKWARRRARRLMV